MTALRRLPLFVAAAWLAGCGGASTPPPDPAAAPPPAPKTDVGKSRAERDAALATGERMSTQEKSDQALSGDRHPD